MAAEESTQLSEAEVAEPRLLRRYREEIVAALMERFGYHNVLAVPRLEKIVVNMGIGRAVDERTRIERGLEELSVITGQRAVVTRARHSVSGFNDGLGREWQLWQLFRKATSPGDRSAATPEGPQEETCSPIPVMRRPINTIVHNPAV